MFPVDFVRHTIEAFCPAGGAVLDPFCGRGTVPFVARASGRESLGIDLNPVGYVFSSAKADPETHADSVVSRIQAVAHGVRAGDLIPENEFQRWAWCPEALGFLRSARRNLDWMTDRTDRTLMSVILVHLHGKAGNAISNQMRQTKGMAPDYSVRWWQERSMYPPNIDPVAYFEAKVRWRYRHGIPTGPDARIVLGDSRSALPCAQRRYDMLLTSPPYCKVTNYRVDNWIRLWMLGEAPLPSWEVSQRYGHRENYSALLRDVFGASARVLSPEATVYVRTDARSFTLNATAGVLKAQWPGRTLLARHGRPKRSQTAHYGDESLKPGEVDLLLSSEPTRRPLGFEIADELIEASEARERTTQVQASRLADAA